jgi:hypothetical protein
MPYNETLLIFGYTSAFTPHTIGRLASDLEISGEAFISSLSFPPPELVFAVALQLEGFLQLHPFFSG